MKTYCLSYDTKNKQGLDADELRKKIVQVLSNAGAENLTSPVTTTIFFVDVDNMKFKHWVEQIENNLGEIYYYLCLVASYADTTIPIHITNRESPMLYDNFQGLIKKNLNIFYC